jgi:hypothetical protein
MAHRFILYDPVSDLYKLQDVAPCTFEDRLI